MTEQARVADVHEIAAAMPFVTVAAGTPNPVYQVGGKSFIFFRTPRPDAFDPETGERYTDVIVFWVPSEEDKVALVQGRVIAVLHDAALQGAPLGTAAGEPDR